MNDQINGLPKNTLWLNKKEPIRFFSANLLSFGIISFAVGEHTHIRKEGCMPISLKRDKRTGYMSRKHFIMLMKWKITVKQHPSPRVGFTQREEG